MATPSRPLRTAAALAALAALTLAGCSAGERDTTSTDDGVTLSFLTWLPTQDQWPALVAAFEKENPGITIEFTRDEDYGAFRTSLDNEIQADEVPDIYGIQVGASFDDYAEFAMPVEDYATDWIDGVNAGARKETTTTEGTEAAVPILMAGQEFYLYNKTLLDELGLSLPTTYDELVAVSKAATAAGYSPFAMGAADGWHDVDFFIWMSNQYGSGGEIYRAASGEADWDSPTLVAAATDWQKLFTDGVFQPGAVTTNTYPQARDDYFLNRKAIAMPTGSWHVGLGLSNNTEKPGSKIEADEVGMAQFPVIGDKDAGATSGVDFALALSDQLDGEKLAAATKFVEFMAVGTGQQMWVDLLQGFPAATDVEVKVADGEKPLAVASVDTVAQALAESTYPRKLSVPGKDSLENDLGVVLQNIAGGADPAKELGTLND